MRTNTSRLIIIGSVVGLLVIIAGSMFRSFHKSAGHANSLANRRTDNLLLATELNKALAVLEDPGRRTAESIDLRIEAQNALRSYIESAGESLIDRAIDCVLQWSADTELRKRAMLIIAQVSLRSDQKIRLQKSQILEVRAYHHILCERSKDVLQTIRSVQPEDVRGGASPHVKPIPGDTLAELGQQLAPILLHEEIHKTKDRARRDGSVCDGVSHRFLFTFSPMNPFWAGEIALVANGAWNPQSDSGTPDVHFVAVFQKATGRDKYVLQSYERLDEAEQIVDVLVGDLNGDDTEAEFAVRTKILGASSGTGILRAYDGWDPILPHKLFSFGPSFSITVFESEHRVLFITSEFYLDAFVGGAMRAVGALGFEKTLWRWDGLLERTAALYTSLEWEMGEDSAIPP